MSDAPPETYLTRLAAAAQAAERAETAFRRSYAQRLAGLERERVFAHRRLALVDALRAAMERTEDEAEAYARGARVLEAEFGLSAANEAHRPILDAFRPVLAALDQVLNIEEEPDHEGVASALASFESWYEARTGQPFLALYDTYVPATPVVDF